MTKIPEISVGIEMERSVSVSSERNIQDHLWRWSTYFAVPFSTNRFIGCVLVYQYTEGISIVHLSLGTLV